MAERLFRVYRSLMDVGRCKGCDQDIHKGDLMWDDGTITYHWRCGKRAGLKKA